MPSLSFMWLGHATFRFRSPSGKRIILDPWVTSNPSCPDSAKKVGELDLMLVTHGHSDHTGDAVSIARSSGADVVAPFETAVGLQSKERQKVPVMNPGGPRPRPGRAAPMGPPVHSDWV